MPFFDQKLLGELQLVFEDVTVVGEGLEGVLIEDFTLCIGMPKCLFFVPLDLGERDLLSYFLQAMELLHILYLLLVNCIDTLQLSFKFIHFRLFLAQFRVVLSEFLRYLLDLGVFEA